MGAELLSVRSLHGAPGRVGPRHDDGRVADAPVTPTVAVPTVGGATAAAGVEAVEAVAVEPLRKSLWKPAGKSPNRPTKSD
ncbi:hypothetical protein ACFV5J_23575 [Streptomyces zaomyceticus]|uniref:hypothetical protein n=1 Tax=Streptomyces zaomyceticus TaxID=68286 RepID=UPI00365C1A24